MQTGRNSTKGVLEPEASTGGEGGANTRRRSVMSGFWGRFWGDGNRNDDDGGDDDGVWWGGMNGWDACEFDSGVCVAQPPATIWFSRGCHSFYVSDGWL